MKKSEWKSTALILFIILCLVVGGGQYDNIKEAIPENTSDIIPSGESVSDSIDKVQHLWAQSMYFTTDLGEYHEEK